MILTLRNAELSRRIQRYRRISPRRDPILETGKGRYNGSNHISPAPRCGPRAGLRHAGTPVRLPRLCRGCLGTPTNRVRHLGRRHPIDGDDRARQTVSGAVQLTPTELARLPPSPATANGHPRGESARPLLRSGRVRAGAPIRQRRARSSFRCHCRYRWQCGEASCARAARARDRCAACRPSGQRP